MTERKRRVLVLNHFAAPLGQAGGTRHAELFGRLDDWEHLIVVGDRNYLSGDRVRSGGGFLAVPVTSYTSSGWQRILNWASYAWRAFFAGVRQGNVDVVYASSPHLLAALAGCMIASVKGVPLVLEVRDLWPKVLLDMGQLTETSLVYRALHGLEGFLYSRATTIVILAEGSRSVLESRGVPEDKIVLIPNGADPADMVPSASRDQLRDRYGFTRFTALYAGAHGPANGLNLLLDAASDLQEEDVDIVLVGGGAFKPALMATAKSRNLSNVRFLDPVPKTEIPDLLAGADVGLHVLADVELFRTAVSPNKVFDYMAAGLPVLTNCPGMVSQLVQDSQCGVAAPPRDIAKGLRELEGKSEDDLARRGASGREWISAHQSRTIMARRLEDALNAIEPRSR